MSLKKNLIVGASILTISSMASGVFIDDYIQADEIKASEVNYQEEKEVNLGQISNLEVGEKYSKSVVTSDGQSMTVEIEKIADLEENNIAFMSLTGYSQHHVRENVSDGTYNVNVVQGVTNAGFKIDIVGGKISKAYDPWHLNLGSVDYSLQKDSDYQATMSMDFGLSIPWIGGPSWTGGVRAALENGNLVTYVH